MVRAYTKTVTPAQAGANRANGRRGGRPAGKISREEADARKAVAKTLQQRCQENELEYVGILESIARNELAPAAARTGAISLLFDRGRGRPLQPHDVGIGGTIFVCTGVPEPEPGDSIPEPRAPHMPEPWPVIEHTSTVVPPQSEPSQPEPEPVKPKALKWSRG